MNDELSTLENELKELEYPSKEELNYKKFKILNKIELIHPEKRKDNKKHSEFDLAEDKRKHDYLEEQMKLEEKYKKKIMIQFNVSNSMKLRKEKKENLWY